MTHISQPIVVIDSDTTVDDLVQDTRDGANLIRFGSSLVIALEHAPQDVLDKLATLTASAANVSRTRMLREVA